MPSSAVERLLWSRGEELVWVDDVTPFRCTGCAHVLYHHYTAECGHKLCQDCVDTQHNTNQDFRCPLPACAQPSECILWKEDAEFVERLTHLRTHCPNRMYGCPTVVQLKDLKEHLLGCKDRKPIIKAFQTPKISNKGYQPIGELNGSEAVTYLQHFVTKIQAANQDNQFSILRHLQGVCEATSNILRKRSCNRNERFELVAHIKCLTKELLSVYATPQTDPTLNTGPILNENVQASDKPQEKTLNFKPAEPPPVTPLPTCVVQQPPFNMEECISTTMTKFCNQMVSKMTLIEMGQKGLEKEIKANIELQLSKVKVTPLSSEEAVVTSSSRETAILLSRGETGCLPLRKETRGIPLKGETEGLPLRRETRGIPLRGETRGLPLRRETEGLPLRGETRDIPLRRETEPIPSSREPVITPLNGEAATFLFSSQVEVRASLQGRHNSRASSSDVASTNPLDPCTRNHSSNTRSIAREGRSTHPEFDKRKRSLTPPLINRRDGHYQSHRRQRKWRDLSNRLSRWEREMSKEESPSPRRYPSPVNKRQRSRPMRNHRHVDGRVNDNTSSGGQQRFMFWGTGAAIGNPSVRSLVGNLNPGESHEEERGMRSTQYNYHHCNNKQADDCFPRVPHQDDNWSKDVITCSWHDPNLYVDRSRALPSLVDIPLSPVASW